MGKDSSISWTNHTFNPWWGCAKVSEACNICYAKIDAHRRGHDVWGKNAERRFFGDTHWAEPLKWNRDAASAGIRSRVFCASMADVFEDRPDLVIHRERLWRLIADTPWLDWLLLTKRPENVLKMVPWGNDWPTNVWLGATVENQKCADERMPHLVKCPAKVRFMSSEPLLGPLDLSSWIKPGMPSPIHLIIAGGESGAIAECRPTHPDWFRSLRDFSAANSIAFHFKQWGCWVPAEPALEKKGRPEMQLSEPSPVRMLGMNKLSTGRLLDGKVHDELPASVATLSVQPAPALNDDDLAYLASRESIVREGLTGTIVAAIALREIRTYMDGKLWRSSHGSFPGYIRDKWAYAKAHVYRLLASGKLIHEIETKANAEKSPRGDWLPSCESHMRPLKDIPKAKRADCWMSIVAKIPPAELTENYVKTETAKFAEAIGVAISKPKAKSPPAKVKAADFLEKLRAVVQEMPTASEINAILAQVDPYLV